MIKYSKNEISKASKFLSFILRHSPEYIDLQLDINGWVDISTLIKKASNEISLSEALIKEVARSSDKQRFALSKDGLKIRANQGHSIKVDLELQPQKPPSELFHGTATRFIDSILHGGLVAGKRQHVHLSTNKNTAYKVGQRHGKPLILCVDAENMFNQGFQFLLSNNNVWLIEHVPPHFLTIKE